MAVQYLREIAINPGIGGSIFGNHLLGVIKNILYVESDSYSRSIIERRIADAVFDRAPIFDRIGDVDLSGYRERTDAVQCGPGNAAGEAFRRTIEETEPIYVWRYLLQRSAPNPSSAGRDERWLLDRGYISRSFEFLDNRFRQWSAVVGKFEAASDKPGVYRMDDGSTTRSFRFESVKRVRSDWGIQTDSDRIGRHTSVLYELWEAFNKKKLSGTLGRSQPILQEEILQQRMRDGIQPEEDDLQRRLQEESQKIQEADVRDVRESGGVGDPSCERRLVGQLTGEFDDFMLYVSREAPLEGLAVHGAEFLRSMWRACYEAGFLRETLQTLPEVWKSLSNEDKAWVLLRVDRGDPRHAPWPGSVREIPEGQRGKNYEAHMKALEITPPIELTLAAWEIMRRL